MRYSILLEDAEGVSYFEDREADLSLQDFVPPAAPLRISERLTATGFVFLSLPVGWKGVQHRSPHRQIAAILSGTGFLAGMWLIGSRLWRGPRIHCRGPLLDGRHRWNRPHFFRRRRRTSQHGNYPTGLRSVSNGISGFGNG